MLQQQFLTSFLAVSEGCGVSNLLFLGSKVLCKTKLYPKRATFLVVGYRGS